MHYDIHNLYGIHGDVAIISGAAGGIGEEVAIAMGSLGAKLALIDINEKAIEELEARLTGMGVEAISITTNITHKKDVESMARTVAEHYGKIDVLVNCAGVSHLEDAVTFSEDKWDWVMEVNVKGIFLTCQAVGQYMLQQKKGRIVNFSSVRGLQGRAKDMAYAPSKGAINQLTKSLAIEWAQENINVNAIAPSFTDTGKGMSKEVLGTSKDSTAALQWGLNRIPKGKIGETRNIVGVVIFFCSPCTEFVTGQILYGDGGWTAA